MHYHQYHELLENNERWIEEKLATSPDYFQKLAEGQRPPYLFIGCSDSRMPLNSFTKTEPGELFIHRNVANQVSLTDMNLLAVLEYAVESLQVQHIVICGHYCCGGVEAAYKGTATGVVENWITPIRDLYLTNKTAIDALPEAERLNRLAELNVVEQVKNICKTSVMHRAFQAGSAPQVHGWVLDIAHGRIKDLQLPMDSWKQLGIVP
ncbi:carbonic anhydrase [Pontibacter actiniarum]|uniref:Carbonic anhydrase n=1 Tax=Pontibacter actiniarum TaxID=323450 RepID=A0A1X9YQD9_9BACT|nr:carbonic anhydrase [Pontibacter actiniarum]ARS35083.1 carbonic anhydrase [Pontibacter actiniarum]